MRTIQKTLLHGVSNNNFSLLPTTMLESKEFVTAWVLISVLIICIVYTLYIYIKKIIPAIELYVNEPVHV